ncbi:MAG: T9SS type A sorting domain-containing protein [Cytophagales bacterium]|nr:T9SS type A sorting domain-containing protein [Cytophagales bacterium]
MKILLTSTILFLLIFIAPIYAQNSWTWQELNPMPEKVSNNAVAAAVKDSVTYVYSFMGIDSTKLWSGIHLKAFRYNTQTNVWDTIAPVPDNLTRIAASANTVKNKIYIIGGYHVYANNSEVSSNKIFIYDPQSDSYSQGVNLPVAIDDQVQVVWRDSLIFIITGWSNTGNVSSVQIYNPALDTIMQGTPVPNNNLYKAFGASGVIIGDTIYYCGGVEHSTWKNVNFLRKGVINPVDPSDITWTNPATNPGDKGYRMGAVVYGNTGFWIGGAGNSYNYDGIAYDGTGGVDPLDRIMAYHAKSQTWEVDTATPFSVMDLRNITQIDSNQYIIAGGMLPGQAVSNRAFLLTYTPPPVTGITSIKSADNIKVYPNPVNNTLQVNINGTVDNSTLKIELMDITGKILIDEKIAGAIITYQLNMREYATGSYFLRITNEKEQLINSYKIQKIN